MVFICYYGVETYMFELLYILLTNYVVDLKDLFCAVI